MAANAQAHQGQPVALHGALDSNLLSQTNARRPGWYPRLHGSAGRPAPVQLLRLSRPRGSQQHEARVPGRRDLRHGRWDPRACRSLRGRVVRPPRSAPRRPLPRLQLRPPREGARHGPRHLSRRDGGLRRAGTRPREPRDGGESTRRGGGPERRHRGVRPRPEARPLSPHPFAGRRGARLASRARDRGLGAHLGRHLGPTGVRNRPGGGDPGTARAPARRRDLPRVPTSDATGRHVGVSGSARGSSG